MNKITILHLQRTFYCTNLSSLHDHDVKFKARAVTVNRMATRKFPREFKWNGSTRLKFFRLPVPYDGNFLRNFRANGKRSRTLREK